jgi:hypothetical protein
MCGGYGHVSVTCHQIWRFYRPVDAPRFNKVANIERYCYNCASKGHLGDDCLRPRPLYVQGGRVGMVVSAFGEGNVPAWVDPPSSQQKSKSSSKRKSRDLEEGEEEEDDGWFGEYRQNKSQPSKSRRKDEGIKPKLADRISESKGPSRSSSTGKQHSRSRLPPRKRSPKRELSSADRYRPRRSDGYRPSSRDRPRDWTSEADRWRRDRAHDDEKYE